MLGLKTMQDFIQKLIDGNNLTFEESNHGKKIRRKIAANIKITPPNLLGIALKIA